MAGLVRLMQVSWVSGFRLASRYDIIILIAAFASVGPSVHAGPFDHAAATVAHTLETRRQVREATSKLSSPDAVVIPEAIESKLNSVERLGIWTPEEFRGLLRVYVVGDCSSLGTQLPAAGERSLPKGDDFCAGLIVRAMLTQAMLPNDRADQTALFKSLLDSGASSDRKAELLTALRRAVIAEDPGQLAIDEIERLAKALKFYSDTDEKRLENAKKLVKALFDAKKLPPVADIAGPELTTLMNGLGIGTDKPDFAPQRQAFLKALHDENRMHIPEELLATLGLANAGQEKPGPLGADEVARETASEASPGPLASNGSKGEALPGPLGNGTPGGENQQPPGNPSPTNNEPNGQIPGLNNPNAGNGRNNGLDNALFNPGNNNQPNLSSNSNNRPPAPPLPQISPANAQYQKGEKGPEIPKGPSLSQSSPFELPKGQDVSADRMFEMIRNMYGERVNLQNAIDGLARQSQEGYMPLLQMLASYGRDYIGARRSALSTRQTGLSNPRSLAIPAATRRSPTPTSLSGIRSVPRGTGLR